MTSSNHAVSRRQHRIGKYLLLSRIGRGGMGVVYRGLDESLDREVAIKTLTAEGSGDDESRARFGIEARASAKLQHPNIITVYELGEDRGMSYIAMELLPGTDLEQLIRSGEQLLLQEKLEIAIQACRGLAFAHEHGIVHRDIKPANLRLLDQGRVKIMDFGIAKVGGEGVTKVGMMIGTLAYMSPEQVRGEALDGRSDVFSLGVVLYQLLAGCRPFPGQGTDVLYKIVHQPTPALDVDLGSAGERLGMLVERALAKTADERFATAGAFGDALKDVLDWYTKSAVPPVLEGDRAVLNDARRLLKERGPQDSVDLFEPIVERNPHSVEARRALRAANRLAYEELNPPEAGSDYPELGETFQLTPTARTPDTFRTEAPATRVLPPRPGSPLSLALIAAAALIVGLGVWFLSRGGGELAPGAGVELSSDAAPGDDTGPSPEAPPVTPDADQSGSGAGAVAAVVELSVTSEPSGAVVLRDGRQTGAITPDTLRLPASQLPPDRLSLTFRKRGYRDAVQTIELPLAADASVHVVLKKGPVRVRVVSDPAGASVSLDGIAVQGTTPLNVDVDPSEKHVLDVSRDGYRTQSKTLAAGNVDEQVSVSLPRAGPPGGIAVRSTYPVDVTMDGRTVASGAVGPSLELPAGRYSVTLSAPSVFMSRSIEIDVKAGETSIVRAPGLGKLNIKATPGNCRVLIDGAFVDYPPILNLPIGEGRHTVTFQWADGSKQEVVQVDAGKPAYAEGRR